MKLVKTSLLVAIILSLVVACTKPEDTKAVDNAAVAEAQAEAAKIAAENEAQAAAEVEAQAKKAAAESEAQAARETAKAAKLAAEAKAAEEAQAAKVAAEAKAAEEAQAEKLAAEAKAAAEAQAAKLAAEAKAAEEAQAAKVAAEAKAAEEAQAAKVEADAEAASEAKNKAQVATAEAQANKAAEVKALSDAQAAKDAAATETAVSKEKAFEFNQDSSDKTPVGAQKSGNAAGTIPAWTGGITKPPAGYKPGDHHQDPFASDPILFTIDASNYKKYSDQLSVGQKAMIEKYPDTYKMNVYQTRRSASFPQRIYQKTIENGKTGKLTSDGEGVVDVAEGFPFPNPKNAYELMWNHKLKYKGSGGVRYNNQVAPTASGRYTVVKLKEELLGKYYTAGNTIADINNILLYFYQVVESPARLAGRILLVHETMDQTKQPRQAWIYNPGQRRVRRAPNVAYDNPGTASDGLRTNDMTDMFNGAMDRFDWKIAGKKEMYVPYNSYKVHSGDLDYPDIIRAGHLNQDLMRYELHRVWVVEATLKEGVRHINSRRTYYLDEDSYQIMLIDHYDRRGELWRFSEAHSINYYDVPTFWSTVEVHYDLRSGRYVALGLDNKDPVNTFNVPLSESNYTPQALRIRGRR